MKGATNESAKIVETGVRRIVCALNEAGSARCNSLEIGSA